MSVRVGIIGYGSRLSGIMRHMKTMDLPVEIAAVADPRCAELKNRRDPLLKDAALYSTADEMLAAAEFDGVMIGTRCSLHATMACKAAPLGLPIFLEKPIAVNFDQLESLQAAAASFTAPVVVSFPLRVSPIVKKVKEIIDSGRLGTVEHAVAFNDVPYGHGYFGGWYRDYRETGGLFLQKATHDFDYLSYVLGQTPKWVCAMKSQRVWGAAGPLAPKPFDLMCHVCAEKAACPESPFNETSSMLDAEERQGWANKRMCLYAEDIRNEDSGNCLIEYANGLQISYTQNFFARQKAARRGARFYGYRGTIEFDWYTNRIAIMPHNRSTVETIDLAGDEAHFGGDQELCSNFLAVMERRAPSLTPLAAGLQSVLTCLWARESAEHRTFCEVTWPE